MDKPLDHIVEEEKKTINNYVYTLKATTNLVQVCSQTDANPGWLLLAQWES